MNDADWDCRIRQCLATARAEMLRRRDPGGFWVGRLSSSALSTATAVSALALADPDDASALVQAGLAWLSAHQNTDGGWGDTPDSPSNLSTTLLVLSAVGVAKAMDRLADSLARGDAFVTRVAGDSAESRIAVLRAGYGEDRTFSTPILANAALAGLVGWDRVPGLPFELAILPAHLFRWMNLGVVSYALPALIAIGQLTHLRCPPAGVFRRLVRGLAVTPTLRLLERIQPESGGFLEAVPLTSFVTMSLAAAGRGDHPVARRGVRFLTALAREDGSWPIDTNLSVWVTTDAVAALADTGWEGVDASALRRWILDRQSRAEHPYTHSPPGGWAWTHLPGGVPDADDTSGALLALAALPGDTPRDVVRMAIRWLLRIQNSDGGWPTFCRGWGRLPFDRSAPDLTAHAIRALLAWREVASALGVGWAVGRGFEYLRSMQRPDGAWAPLWFGNQAAEGGLNLVYGTSRVLAAYRDAGRLASAQVGRAVSFLLNARNQDGGWGGGPGVAPTVEETALAVEALADAPASPCCRDAVRSGCDWLVRAVHRGDLDRPSPIGLYFARLWYSEGMYPVAWTVAALGRALRRSSCAQQATPAAGVAASSSDGT